MFNAKGCVPLNKFCVAPWVSISTDVNGSIRPCCRYEQPEKQQQYKMPWLKDGDIHDLYNGEEMKKLRQAFLDGKMPYECHWCWSEEKAGIESFRERYNAREYNYDLDNPSPQILDLKLSNICNLKCRMCSPQASSLIAKEQGKSNEYWIQNKIIGTEQEKTFFNQWVPNMKELELTGGEPFFSPENKELLTKIVDSGYAKNIKLLITTNGMFYIPELMEKISNFKYVTFSLSIDDLGPRLEYARGNANWNLISKNLKQMKKNYPDFSINIYRTINNYNIYHLDELDRYCLKEDINIVNGVLHDPKHLCIQHLPKIIKQEITEKYESLNSNPYEGILSFMNTPGRDALFSFHTETKRLDNIRNESFVKAFPEWSELLLYDEV